MNRDEMLARVEQQRAWDFVVIGGGATGAGIAVDAAARGFDVLLLEQSDFGKGTSSRSTKLVHGGVRYLEQGNISLVMEALKERGILRQNAPHLVSNLPFVVPNYDWWESPFYGVGLKLYNLLAGRYGFGNSEILSPEETLARLPTIRTEGLRGGVVYYDGQFDDSRLLINLVRTAANQGAALLNYVRVTGITKAADGTVDGVVALDLESGGEFEVSAKVVINAAGPFADAVRQLSDPGAPTLMAPSQGLHLVFDRSFLPGDSAIMVPHTRDGRVMFAIPWHGHTLVGTTDTPIVEPTLEPAPFDEEVSFILETAAEYLHKAPTRDDVLSAFVGIRPLVRSGDSRITAALSRDHTIHIDPSGLLTTTGGKWTTYRHMAEDTVNQAIDLARLPERPCVTKTLNIHGFHPHADRFGPLSVYGSEALAVHDLARIDPSLAEALDPALPYTRAEVVWGVRIEMARTVEDVLARRCRALFLNAAAAARMAPAAAGIMARELGRDGAWEREQVEAFTRLARQVQPRLGRLPPQAAPAREAPDPPAAERQRQHDEQQDEERDQERQRREDERDEILEQAEPDAQPQRVAPRRPHGHAGRRLGRVGGEGDAAGRQQERHLGRIGQAAAARGPPGDPGGPGRPDDAVRRVPEVIDGWDLVREELDGVQNRRRAEHHRVTERLEARQVLRQAHPVEAHRKPRHQDGGVEVEAGREGQAEDRTEQRECVHATTSPQSGAQPTTRTRTLSLRRCPGAIRTLR